MAAGYPLIGANANIQSWGTASNFYADLLTAITPASARVTISGDMHDVTGLGGLNVVKIPGLKSCNVTIGGYGGSAAATTTPYVGNYGSVSIGGVAYFHVQSWEWTARCLAVHDITSVTQASPVLWRYFRPDIFTHSARFTALLDSANVFSVPPDVGTAASTIVLTYGNSQTITLTGFIRQVGVTIAKGNKQLGVFEVDGTSTVAISGGFLSGLGVSDTWGNTVNDFPLWTGVLGSTAQGPMVLRQISGGARSISLADGFWKQIKVGVSPGAPTAVEVDYQATGVVTVV